MEEGSSQHPPKPLLQPLPKRWKGLGGTNLVPRGGVPVSPRLEAAPARPSPLPRGLAGVFQSTKKLFLSERKGQGRSQALEFIRRNAANGLSVANLVAGLSSILCSLNR